MKTQIVGKNIEVTESIRNTIEEEMKVIDKYFSNKDIDAKVLVRTYPVGEKVEVTVFMDKDHTLRQEVVSEDLYLGIKEAVSKMERQIRKFKSRIIDSKQKQDLVNMFNDKNSEEVTNKITKRKTFEDKLMTEEEAILQFELSGHDFYIFTDADSEYTKLIYKRKDLEYGIIEIN